MGMSIEVVGKTFYTVHLTDDDIEKVRNYMKDREDRLPHGKTKVGDYQEENFCWVVMRLVDEGEIELFSDGKATKETSITDRIFWSEHEERTPEEILVEQPLE